MDIKDRKGNKEFRSKVGSPTRSEHEDGKTSLISKFTQLGIPKLAIISVAIVLCISIGAYAASSNGGNGLNIPGLTDKVNGQTSPVDNGTTQTTSTNTQKTQTTQVSSGETGESTEGDSENSDPNPNNPTSTSTSTSTSTPTPTGTKCTACGGDGVIDTASGPVTCRICGGDGYI